MQLTFATEDKVEMLDVDTEFTVGLVEEILLPTLGLSPQQRFQWVVHGRILQTTQKESSLKSLGLAEGDVVNLIPEARRPNPAAELEPTNRRNVRARQNGPVYFEGMSMDDVLHYNPNPLFAVQVLRQRPELLREMGFHVPTLSQAIASAPSDEQAAESLREYLLEHTITRSMREMEEQQRDEDMNRRLRQNPNDVQAKQYIEDKENLQRIEDQRMTVMSEYPETMFQVLMLYISTKINGVAVQAFVDCGAQTSVMSLACAKRCGIDKLIDKRYTGKIVGVGTSVALGKIYIAPIQIGNQFFPMSVTVMESLGDKNMEFLFGLDMLKRHKFCIDLEKGLLTFHGSNGEVCSTPFLHEKDLPQHKGGTMGFDPNQQMEFLEDEEEQSQTASAGPVSSSQTPAIVQQNDPTATAPMDLVDASPATDSSSSDTAAADYEAKVQRLMAQGFEREAVERVLRDLNGDEDTALTVLLFEGGI